MYKSVGVVLFGTMCSRVMDIGVSVIRFVDVYVMMSKPGTKSNLPVLKIKIILMTETK